MDPQPQRDHPSTTLRSGPAEPGRRHTARPAARWLLRRCLWLVICYLVVVGAMMIFERSFIFFPARYPEGDWQPQGISFEDAWFESADGTRIHGWYVPHERPRAVVLFCHGNAGNVSHRAEMLRILHEGVGVSVLIFDYRGYGRSQGRPDEPGVLADARAARKWLATRADVGQEEIVLMGRSLGGAVAVDLAAGQRARALVVESSFSSLPEVAAYHYPWLPVRWMMRTRFDSAGKIGTYHGPLLQSHGTADTIVPYRFGRRLFEAANQPKQFVALPELDHNEPQPVEYYRALIALLDDLRQATPEE